MILLKISMIFFGSILAQSAEDSFERVLRAQSLEELERSIQQSQERIQRQARCKLQKQKDVLLSSCSSQELQENCLSKVLREPSMARLREAYGRKDLAIDCRQAVEQRLDELKYMHQK